MNYVYFTKSQKDGRMIGRKLPGLTRDENNNLEFGPVVFPAANLKLTEEGWYEVEFMDLDIHKKKRFDVVTQAKKITIRKPDFSDIDEYIMCRDYICAKLGVNHLTHYTNVKTRGSDEMVSIYINGSTYLLGIRRGTKNVVLVHKNSGRFDNYAIDIVHPIRSVVGGGMWVGGYNIDTTEEGLAETKAAIDDDDLYDLIMKLKNDNVIGFENVYPRATNIADSLVYVKDRNYQKLTKEVLLELDRHNKETLDYLEKNLADYARNRYSTRDKNNLKYTIDDYKRIYYGFR